MLHLAHGGGEPVFIRLNNRAFGVILVLVGAWFVARIILRPGPWFTGTTWAVLTLAAFAYAAYTRAPGWLVVGFLAAGTAAYAYLNAYLPGGLPGSFYFVFLALGCYALYQFVTRPARWPLLMAALLLALATLFWVLHLAVKFALYLVPLILLVWGLNLLFSARRSPGGRW